MDETKQLLRLFRYDRWANEQIIETLQQNLAFPAISECTNLFAHIVGSQEMWFRRINGQSTENIAIWPDYDLPIALQKLHTLSQKWTQFIQSNQSRLDQTISYQNSSGRSFDTLLGDILHHVIIHSQHHRAQIALLLRQADIAPPATDFIFFTRMTN